MIWASEASKGYFITADKKWNDIHMYGQIGNYECDEWWKYVDTLRYSHTIDFSLWKIKIEEIM